MRSVSMSLSPAEIKAKSTRTFSSWVAVKQKILNVHYFLEMTQNSSFKFKLDTSLVYCYQINLEYMIVANGSRGGRKTVKPRKRLLGQERYQLQLSQPTHAVGSKIKTRAALVCNEHLYHCPIPGRHLRI